MLVPSGNPHLILTIRLLGYTLVAPFLLAVLLLPFLAAVLDFVWFRLHTIFAGKLQRKGVWEF